jgi:hypothetical protein
MSLNLLPFLVLWAVLAAVVLLMIAYRAAVARHEDDSLHVIHGASAVPQQATVSERLETIDKWGKRLTVITIVFGLLLGAVYAYQSWVQGATRTGL